MIEQVAGYTLAPIRHQVLWPHKPMAFVILPEDDQGYHFGYYKEGKLVGGISVFVDGTSARFRKFAVLEVYQSQGIGSQLLWHVIEFVKTLGVSKLSCHARLSAHRFYNKFGMSRVGEGFEKEGLAYVQMELELCP